MSATHRALTDAQLCVWEWVWHRAISLSYSHMMKGLSRAFPSSPPPPLPSSSLISRTHPSLPPSLPYSTSQFLTWPLHPALWPLSPPPELSLPLFLCDTQWRAGHHFLTPRYSPLSFLFCSCCDSLYLLLTLTPLGLFLSNFLSSFQSTQTPSACLLDRLCVT